MQMPQDQTCRLGGHRAVACLVGCEVSFSLVEGTGAFFSSFFRTVRWTVVLTFCLSVCLFDRPSLCLSICL